MGPVVIRSAELDDLGDLADVFRTASLSNEGDRENLLAHPEFLELSDRAIVEGRLRLAAVDGVTVGFASGTQAGREVELEDLFVAPDWMRKGVATRLVTDLIERSPRQEPHMSSSRRTHTPWPSTWGSGSVVRTRSGPTSDRARACT